MSVLNAHRVARQGDATLHVVFQQVHRQAVVLMRIGIVKHQHVIPFHLPKSWHAVNLHVLFFRSFPNVENSGSHDTFVYQDVVTGQQGGLHGIGGDMKGSDNNNFQKPPNNN